MADDIDLSDFFRMMKDPYSSKHLYTRLRKLIRLIGTWPVDNIDGREFQRYTDKHDDLRLLSAWNFIIPIHHDETPEYEPIMRVNDWEIYYKVTAQARELVKLELNNISDLHRAILIFLRADHAAEQRMGFWNVPLGQTIGFYELVMLLNKSEHAMQNALQHLHSTGMIKAKFVATEEGQISRHSEFEITNIGINYLEGATMSFTNVSISGSGHSFIGSQLGTSNSTLNAYIEALQVDSYSSEKERELKQALASFRRGIETDPLLQQHQRQGAAGDLALFSEELKKPVSEQNADKKSFYWGRLTEATKFSAALVTLAAAVAKLTGLA